tara:strand:+ start:144 stop:305 length:162 start_codon:yes stop_codon:yes gene_type:complete
MKEELKEIIKNLINIGEFDREDLEDLSYHCQKPIIAEIREKAKRIEEERKARK